MYFQESSKEFVNEQVLEIGCGSVFKITPANDLSSEKIISFLSQKFPNLSWEFTDVPIMSTRSKGIIKPFDLSQGNSIGKLFHRIIGIGVLDTIPYGDLSKAMRSISGSLKAEGIFIHIADKPLYMNAFMDSCADPDKIILPCEKNDRVYQISKKEYSQIIKSKKNL